VHAIGHPQQIRERQLERFRRAADQTGAGPQALSIQTRFRQPSLDRAFTKGAALEHPLAQ